VIRRRRFVRDRNGRVRPGLEETERALLRALPTQARGLVDREEPSARRLFPVAYPHDAAAEAEYGEMLGGYYDEHPWMTFDAPIIVEDPTFPGMRQWPASFVFKDEIYQIRNFSREKVRVLMRLDSSKLDLANPRVHRKDRDFAVTWAKMYGKGRVYYSTLGHPVENWDRPEMQTMYAEAIKWAMGLVDADVTPRPAP